MWPKNCRPATSESYLGGFSNNHQPITTNDPAYPSLDSPSNQTLESFFLQRYDVRTNELIEETYTLLRLCQVLSPVLDVSHA